MKLVLLIEQGLRYMRVIISLRPILQKVHTVKESARKSEKEREEKEKRKRNTPTQSSSGSREFTSTPSSICLFTSSRSPSIAAEKILLFAAMACYAAFKTEQ